jgi:hypothetical protein
MGTLSKAARTGAGQKGRGSKTGNKVIKVNKISKVSMANGKAQIRQ